MFKYLFFSILFSVTTVYGQEKILLDEHFVDNSNKWPLCNSKEFNVNIKNGVLHIEKFNTNYDSRGCLWYSKEIGSLNTAQDFSVILNAKCVSGGDIFNVLDFQWGVLSSKDIPKKSILYQLNIFLDGNVRLDFFQSKWDNFNKVNIKERLDEINFDPREYNKYQITQKKGFLYLTINNVEVFKQYIFPTEGNSIGFQQCLKSAWEIDDLVVSQIQTTVAQNQSVHVENENPEAIIKEKDNLIENAGLSVFAADELVIYPSPFKDRFTVKFNLNRSEQVDIYLISITGNVVKKETRFFEKGEVNFNMEALVPDGVYIVRVISEHNKLLFKKITRFGSD
jgi:hypothetical protein